MSELAELWGIYRGLNIILQKGMQEVLIESDADQMVQWIVGETPSNCPQRALLEDTKFLLDRCKCSLVSISCEGTKCADSLANLGVNHKEPLVVFEDPPAQIVSLLIADMVGLSCERA
ncbi:unnamed protein product [Camellia sinensis]